MPLSSKKKAQIDQTIERNLMTLAGDARLIGLEEAVGVLKLADSKEQALAILFRRIEELRRLKARLDFLDDTDSEPVYLGDVDDQDRDS